MRLFKKIIYIALCSVSLVAQAQISHGGLPLPKDLDAGPCLRSGSEIVRMPAFDVEELRREDSLAGNNVGGIRFAYAFDVDYTPENSGARYHLKDGRDVWRLHIVSEGAYSLNLIFDEYQLDDSSQLFIYTPDRSAILGSFTAENNSDCGVLATAPVPGDEVVVELITPRNSGSRLRVGNVNHDYRGLKYFPTAGSSQDCQVDASCRGIHEQQSRSSVVIIVAGTEYCSGTMLNNTSNDGVPLLVTAAHCLYKEMGQVDESRAQRSVFFFNFERPHCHEEITGSLEMSISGADVAFSSTSSDALVMKLRRCLPIDYRVYFAGWNATRELGAGAYSFHHPNSDMRKISEEEDSPYLGTFLVDDIFDSNIHWIVDQWESGIMEGGSSGAALFDAKDLVVGALSGGDTKESCYRPGYDAFWAFSETWERGLKDCLDPTGTGRNVCEGKETHLFPCTRVTNWNDGESIHRVSSYEQFAAGHNNKGIVEYAEEFHLPEKSSVLYGVYLAPWQGVYSDRDTVLLRVYRGDSLPGEVLCQEAIAISNTAVARRSGVFEEREVSLWSMRDCYYRLKQPLRVDSSFFVGLKLVSSPTNKFALCHTEEKLDGKNTAYFKDASGWHTFDSAHPYYKQPTSLYIEPVLQVGGSSAIAVDDHLADGPASIAVPNPVEDVVTVRFPSSRTVLCYELVDMAGRLARKVHVEKSAEELSFRMDVPSGIYFLRMVFESSTETLRLVKK